MSSRLPYWSVALLIALSAASFTGLSAQPRSGLRITVLDAEGRPARGVTVHVLRGANIDLADGRESLVLERLKTDRKGRVRPIVTDHGFGPSFFAFSATEAALHTVVDQTRREVTIRLGAAARVRAKLVDPKGRPVTKARVRAMVFSNFQGLGVDGTVEKDGTLRFPPIPVSGMDKDGAGVQVVADGFVPMTVSMARVTGSEVAEIRLGAPRNLTGRVVTVEGEPVVGAKVAVFPAARLRDIQLIPRDAPTTDRDGRFEVKGLTPRTSVLYVVPREHASWSTEIPAGNEAVELKQITVDAGEPIHGTVREHDGVTILHSLVAVADSRGVRLASGPVGEDGGFRFPHLAPGTYQLTLYVHRSDGIAGSRCFNREVQTGSEPLKLTLPHGLVVRLVDDKGAPVDVRHVTYRVDGHRRWADGWEGSDSHHEGAIREVRLRIPGPASFRVSIKVVGYERAEFAVRVDADGKGTAAAVLVRKPGESPEPLRDPWADRRPAVRSREKSEALKAIKLPERPTRSQVESYVRAIMETARGHRSFGSDDPEVEMLAAVGARHVDVLIDVKRDHRGAEGDYIRIAIQQLAEKKHRKMIIAGLVHSPDLVEVIVYKGWQKAAKKALIDGLGRQHSVSLPTEWIETVAAYRDRKSYPGLRACLIRGPNRRHTFEVVRNLPGFKLTRAVQAMWKEAAGDGIGRLDAAIVAAECGIVEALGVLIAELASAAPERFRPDDLPQVVESLAGHPGSPAEYRAWFETNRKRLKFDKKKGYYRVR